jgi:hypothetical protein
MNINAVPSSPRNKELGFMEIAPFPSRLMTSLLEGIFSVVDAMESATLQFGFPVKESSTLCSNFTLGARRYTYSSNLK